MPMSAKAKCERQPSLRDFRSRFRLRGLKIGLYCKYAEPQLAASMPANSGPSFPLMHAMVPSRSVRRVSPQIGILLHLVRRQDLRRFEMVLLEIGVGSELNFVAWRSKASCPRILEGGSTQLIDSPRHPSAGAIFNCRIDGGHRAVAAREILSDGHCGGTVSSKACL